MDFQLIISGKITDENKHIFDALLNSPGAKLKVAAKSEDDEEPVAKKPRKTKSEDDEEPVAKKPRKTKSEDDEEPTKKPTKEEASEEPVTLQEILDYVGSKIVAEEEAGNEKAEAQFKKFLTSDVDDGGLGIEKLGEIPKNKVESTFAKIRAWYKKRADKQRDI